jgi:lauroyl/myristoyl acyltransferase
MNSEARVTPDMLKPRYWGTWLLLWLLWLVMWLPRTWVMVLGTWVGEQMYKRNRKRRHIAEVNIDLCFPHLSPAQRSDMVVEHFRCYGRGFMDMGLIMIGTVPRIQRFSEVHGMEHILDNLGDPGVIMVTFHTTTLDMCSSSMLSDIPLVTMMKRDRNPVLNRFMYRSRTRYNNCEMYMRDQSLRGILEGMRNGKSCYIVPDEDFGEGKHSVYAPFFGQPRSTLAIVSRFARRTGAAVIPCICRLVPQTGRYVTTVAPPLDDFPGDDEVENATQINQAMEQLIMHAPEQYLWTFRWFRTRPGAMENPYERKDQDQDQDQGRA